MNFFSVIGKLNSGINKGSLVYKGSRGGKYFIKNNIRRYLNTYDLFYNIN